MENPIEELKVWVGNELEKAKLDAEIAALTSIKNGIENQITAIQTARTKLG